MFNNRPYRRQRPLGTTPNASKFWFLELVDSRKSLAGVYAQAMRRLCVAYTTAVSMRCDSYSHYGHEQGHGHE